MRVLEADAREEWAPAVVNSFLSQKGRLRIQIADLRSPTLVLHQFATLLRESARNSEVHLYRLSSG